jgi:hypothetical protein
MLISAPYFCIASSPFCLRCSLCFSPQNVREITWKKGRAKNLQSHVHTTNTMNIQPTSMRRPIITPISEGISPQQLEPSGVRCASLHMITDWRGNDHRYIQATAFCLSRDLPHITLFWGDLPHITLFWGDLPHIGDQCF